MTKVRDTDMVKWVSELLNDLNWGERERIVLHPFDDCIQMYVHYKTKTDLGRYIEHLLVEESQGGSSVILHVGIEEIHLHLCSMHFI